MIYDNSIYTILSTHSGLTDLVGVGELCRIYPIKAPQTTSNPCVIINERLDQLHDSKSGVSDLDIIIILIDVYADLKSECDNIVYIIRQLLDGYSGIVDDANIENIQLQPSTFSIWDDEADSYRTSIEFKVRQKI